eukprot:Polyplicarium_translucidae@DN2994_c0_g1_i10.p1
MKKNDDFRELLGPSEDAESKKRGIAALLREEKQRLRAVKMSKQSNEYHKEKRRRGKEAKAESKEEAATAAFGTTEHDPKYKDRARDRRNRKEEEPEEEVKIAQQVTIDESKFLGGDTEHTHLVKGLDFSLLSKVRSEIRSKEQQEAAVKAGKKQGNVMERVGDGASAVLKAIFGGCHPLDSKSSEKLDLIRTAVLQGRRFKGNTERFLPGRVSLAFQLGSPGAQPCEVYASRAKVGEDDKLVVPLPSELRKDLKQAMEWHRENRRKGRKGKAMRPGAEASPAEGAPPPRVVRKAAPAVGDDIFSGAGLMEDHM